MSELKAHRIDNIISAYKIGKAFCMKTEEEVYIKSEADKVIVEKDKEIAQLQSMLEERNKQIGELKEHIDELQKATDSAWSKVNAMYDELRHHKYKRCLAMAKWCEYFANYWECCEPPDCFAFIARAKFHRKWHKRWLELAEKFKEAK